MYKGYIHGMKVVTIEFEQGDKEFMTFAILNVVSSKIRCSCSKCQNKKF
jgi:hypothetical protein